MLQGTVMTCNLCVLIGQDGFQSFHGINFSCEATEFFSPCLHKKCVSAELKVQLQSHLVKRTQKAAWKLLFHFKLDLFKKFNNYFHHNKKFNLKKALQTKTKVFARYFTNLVNRANPTLPKAFTHNEKLFRKFLPCSISPQSLPWAHLIRSCIFCDTLAQSQSWRECMSEQLTPYLVSSACSRHPWFWIPLAMPLSSYTAIQWLWTSPSLRLGLPGTKGGKKDPNSSCS